MSNTNLVRVSTYAKQKEVTVQTIYEWIKDGKVESETVDGMIFIKTEEK